VSFATDSEYDDLGHGYIRRPISVTELLEREGYRPQARSRATRRALSGVAAGAVLALGAVVGSLFLSHPSATTPGGTLASGGESGGDIVLAESGAPQHVTTTPQVPSQSLATVPSSAQANGSNSARSGQGVQQLSQRSNTSSGAQGTISGSWHPGTNKVTPSPTTSSSHAVTQSPATTGQSAPTTQSAPSTSQPQQTTPSSPSTSQQSNTTTGSSSSTSGSPSGSASSGNGGLLGTVTGAVNDLTAPVFNWFGG
jgi:hypothetical protein